VNVEVTIGGKPLGEWGVDDLASQPAGTPVTITHLLWDAADIKAQPVISFGSIMEPDESAQTDAALTRARRRWGCAEIIAGRRLA
jgi:hypothetical protein